MTWKQKIKEYWNEHDGTNFYYDELEECVGGIVESALNEAEVELKQCPECHTMKRYSTEVCYRCLDRREAKREFDLLLKEKVEEIKKLQKTEFSKYDRVLGYNAALNDVINLLE